jgi:hypothetical protein
MWLHIFYNLSRTSHTVVTCFPGNGNGKQRLVIDAMRSRPNIVTSGSTMYNDDNWKRLHIGDAYFTISVFCPSDPIAMSRRLIIYEAYGLRTKVDYKERQN